MRYSLVLHANGPEPKDFHIYLTDAESPLSYKNSWFSVGLLQSIRFELKATDFHPDLRLSCLGLSIRPHIKPEFNDGILIFCEKAISVDEKVVGIPTIGNTRIYQCQPVSSELAKDFEDRRKQHNIPSLQPSISDQHKVLGGVQRVLFEADLKTNTAALELDGFKSLFFDKTLVKHNVNWRQSVPSWVKVGVQDLDALNEIGTDGVIDHIGENAVLKETLQPILVERIKK